MRNFFRLLAFLFVGILVIGCGKVDQISIGEINEFNVKGFKDNSVLVEVELSVTNPSIYKIKLIDLDINTFIEGKYIGKLIIDENIIIDAKKTETYLVPVKIKISNILNVAFVMMNLKRGKQVNMRFEGKVTAKSFLMKREIEIKEKRKVTI